MVNLEDYSLHLIQNQEYHSDTDSSDNNDYRHNYYVPRKRNNNYLNLDDWVTVYNDDLYYIWNIIREYTNHNVPILDQLDFSKFVILCFENSSKSRL